MIFMFFCSSFVDKSHQMNLKIRAYHSLSQHFVVERVYMSENVQHLKENESTAVNKMKHTKPFCFSLKRVHSKPNLFACLYYFDLIISYNCSSSSLKQCAHFSLHAHSIESSEAESALTGWHSKFLWTAL